MKLYLTADANTVRTFEYRREHMGWDFVRVSFKKTRVHPGGSCVYFVLVYELSPTNNCCSKCCKSCNNPCPLDPLVSLLPHINIFLLDYQTVRLFSYVTAISQI